MYIYIGLYLNISKRALLSALQLICFIYKKKKTVIYKLEKSILVPFNNSEFLMTFVIYLTT